MSSLTPGSFPANEAAAIQNRLDKGALNLAGIQAGIDTTNQAIQRFADLDAANQRVQDQAIEEIVAILHQIVKDRDTAQPSEAPHFIDFLSSFPVTLGDLAGGDPFPTIPPYTTPDVSKSVANSVGWELWRTITGTPEVDPQQPTAGELGANYVTLTGEFDDFQTYRLVEPIGSYLLKTRFTTTVSLLLARKAVIEGRNNFYLSIGFTVST